MLLLLLLIFWQILISPDCQKYFFSTNLKSTFNVGFMKQLIDTFWVGICFYSICLPLFNRFTMNTSGIRVSVLYVKKTSSSEKKLFEHVSRGVCIAESKRESHSIQPSFLRLMQGVETFVRTNQCPHCAFKVLLYPLSYLLYWSHLTTVFRSFIWFVFRIQFPGVQWARVHFLGDDCQSYSQESLSHHIRQKDSLDFTCDECHYGSDQFYPMLQHHLRKHPQHVRNIICRWRHMIWL